MTGAHGRPLPRLAAGRRARARAGMTDAAPTAAGGASTSRSPTTGTSSSSTSTCASTHGELTAIVGPNACGKSTLLRALARMLHPRGGRRCSWTAEPSARCPTKQVARRLGLLPQTPIAPDGITVTDLVARGRHPHQRLLRQWSREDERAVAAALEADGHDRPRRAVRRRAVGRAAPARVARHGARPGDRRSCCSTSRRRSSTSPTRSRCSTCAPTCTSRAGRS